MIKFITLILAGLLFLSCVHTDDWTIEKKAKYRRAMEEYERGQTP